MIDYEVQFSTNIAELINASKILEISRREIELAILALESANVLEVSKATQIAYLIREVKRTSMQLLKLHKSLNSAVLAQIEADRKIAKDALLMNMGRLTVLNVAKVLNLFNLLEETDVAVTRRLRFAATNPRSLEQLAARIPDSEMQVRIEKYSANSIFLGEELPRGQGGSDTYIVYLSGTKDWSIDSGDPFDLVSNINLVGKGYAGSLKGVEHAMFKAGISESDQVILVGFSQGGMIASALANMNKYRVSHLVTFGSPTMRTGDASEVIKVKHQGDLVPELLGPEFKDGRLVITADQPANAPAHSMAEYAKTAQKIDLQPSTEIVQLQKDLRNLPENAEVSMWIISRD